MPRFANSTSIPWVCSIGLIIATILLAPKPSVMTQEPPIVAKPLAAAALEDRSYADWQDACASLPPNRDIVDRYPDRKVFPISDYNELDALLDQFFELSKSGPLAKNAHWLGAESPEPKNFFDTTKHYYRDPGVKFTPFVQRLELPAGSTVITHGDLHGDVRSLLHGLDMLNKQGILRGFKLTNAQTHLLFLGDYCDRGIYGTEVLYTLLRLKLANPDQVWMVRGNHEEVRMIGRYGFGHELRYKFGETFDLFKIARLYDFLPVALYLGCEGNYVQCNHGGMEAGFEPNKLLADPNKARFQLIGKLNRRDFLKANPDVVERADDATKTEFDRSYHNFIPEAPVSLDVMGFMWADFSVIPDRTLLRYDNGRPGWMFGKDLTQRMLKATGSDDGPRVRAVFRAHQQSRQLNPMMRRIIASSGVFRHWQEADNVDLLDAIIPKLREHLEVQPKRSIVEGAVYTFNVSPDSSYGKNCGYTFDTFGMVTLKKRFEDWSLHVVNPMVPMK